ncbi:ABC transporter C family member 13 [Tanacetum coccineum]|uniref:ABC transporter C family member 13 n=1 Tax=Tanacetum coccineum TaxID=301880 RepID=A0ABQ5I625_9ASTR
MSSLMNIVPQKAILAYSGKEVNTNHVEINTRVVVKAGTMIPIDGVVIEGNCEVGAQALTGVGKEGLSSIPDIVPDGINIADISLRYLRSRFAVVPQTSFLFKGSLRDNLDPLNLNDDLKIWNALKTCHIEEEVRAIGGLDMQMKESRNSFSVGQRQLLCLARAFLKSTMELCLDECTENVDTQTAAKLKDAKSSECKGLTVITIVHRISTILHMDNVLVLDQGVLEESSNTNKGQETALGI